MNVLIVSDVYFPTLGGMSVAAGQLAHALVDKRHTVSVIAPAYGLKTIKKDDAGVTTYLLPSIPIVQKKGIRFIITTFMIAKLLKRIKPDVIHIFTIGPGTIGQSALITGKKLGIPVVVAIHFVIENITQPLHLPNKLNKQLESFVEKSVFAIAKKADAVIFPTSAAADKFPSTQSLNRFVVSNGLITKRFAEVKETDIDLLRKRLHLPDKKIILYTGRLDNDKKVYLLLKAMPLILQKTDAHLLIIGKGVDADRLRSLTEHLGISSSVTFGGFLEDKFVPVVYRLAYVYVMPSDIELQSISTLEAMVSGLPVIGANALALPLLIHNQKNGFLFTPNDSADLAQKLIQLLTDTKLAHSMGQKSLEYVKEHTMDHVITKFEAVYESIIKKSQTHDVAKPISHS